MILIWRIKRLLKKIILNTSGKAEAVQEVLLWQIQKLILKEEDLLKM